MRGTVPTVRATFESKIARRRGSNSRRNEVELDGQERFFSHVHLHGGPAPVRRYRPKLIELVLNRTMGRERSLT